MCVSADFLRPTHSHARTLGIGVPHLLVPMCGFMYTCVCVCVCVSAAVNMRYRIRTIMDSTPLVVKSLVTLALLAMPQLRRLRLAPALIFAAAQVAFAATTLAGYYIAHRASGAGASGRGARRGAAKAQPPAGGDAGDRDVCSAVVAFSVQSVSALHTHTHTHKHTHTHI